MISFVDGPAATQVLALKRAPLFLRVVQSLQGNWDALDQLGDEPKPREKIFCYVLCQKPQPIHLLMRPRSQSGWYMVAAYRFAPEQPADQVMRDVASWRQWTREHHEQHRPAWARVIEP